MFGKKTNAYTDMNTGNYTVLMFRKIGSKNVQIDKVKINITEQKFRYKGKDFFNFNLNNILFADSKNNYYGFNYDDGKQLAFSDLNLPTNITLAEIDRYVNQGLIKQLTQALEEKKSDKKEYIMFILGAVCGGFGGFIVAQVLSGGIGAIG
jgi:3-dehydroquinate synthetase